jgi:hypothetical protein
MALAATGLAVTSARADEAIETDYGDRTPVSVSNPGPRLVLGEAAFLGLQATWYWTLMGHGGEEMHFDWPSWKTKLFSLHSVVLDEDKFNTGAVGHPIAGTGYYQIARGYGLGPLGSFVASVAAEVTWQYLVEWDTKPATNDIIGTPLAGWVIGEATYRLGRYFAAGTPGIASCVGAAIFSPVATLNDGIVCSASGRAAGGDAAAARARRGWHRFDLGVASGPTTFDDATTRMETSLSAGAELVTNRTYQRPGAGASVARPGQWVDLAGRWLFGEGATRGGFFHAGSSIVGRYARRYDAPDAGAPPNGWGALVALGSSFDFASRDLPSVRDRTASVGLGGPLVELDGRHGILALRARLAASYGLAQVASLAYPVAAPSLDPQSVRGVLAEQGYYYAQAVLPSAELVAEAGDVRVAFDARGGRYWSIDHDDAHQSELRNDFSLRDDRVALAARAGIRPFHGPVAIGVELDSATRDSRAAATTVHLRERQVAGKLDLLF